MTHAEHVVRILSEEIARLEIELAILKASQKLSEEEAESKEVHDTVDTKQVSFFKEENYD